MEAEDNGGGTGMSEHKVDKVSRNNSGETQQQAERPQARIKNGDFSRFSRIPSPGRAAGLRWRHIC